MGTKAKSFLSTIKRNAKCKYASLCRLYTTSSYTCTHTGGSYCGTFRKLSQPKSADTKPIAYVIEYATA